jgi:hypothetical protein
MVNRVASPSVRTPAAAPQTPKAKVAQQAAQTAAAGWGAGAKAPTSLKITAAKIDEGLSTLPKIAVPRGYSVEVKNLSSKASDTVHGKKVGIEQTDQQVTLTGPNGKKMTVGPSGDMPGLLSEWKSDVKAAKAEPKNEYSMLDWDASRTTSGPGRRAPERRHRHLDLGRFDGQAGEARLGAHSAADDQPGQRHLGEAQQDEGPRWRRGQQLQRR